MKTLALIFLVGLSCSDGLLLAQAPAPSTAPTFEQRVQITVTRDKKTRIAGGDYDDKRDQIVLTVKLTNSDTAAQFPDCQAELFVLAESIINRKAFQVLGAEKFTFSLPPRGTHSFTSQEFVTSWDRTDARFGAKYDGWVLVVRDSAGKVLTKKSTSPSWLPLAEKLGTLPVKAFYDRELKPVKLIR